jgi:hypothetical protein
MTELATDVARLVDDVNYGHLATLLPDGSPHSVPREVLDGDAAWRVIDRISHKYTGKPYPLRSDRVVLLIEPEQAQAITFG